MEQRELDKLKAVLPGYMKLVQDVHDNWQVYDEHHDEIFTLMNETSASSALEHLLGCYASMGRKSAKEEMQKQLRDLLGLTHSLNDVHQRIGVVNTRLIEVEENYVRVERHAWDAAGERCVKCGDMDRMGGACSGARQADTTATTV